MTLRYLTLIIWLTLLTVVYLRFPQLRLITSIIVGISYSVWGIIIHHREKGLLWPVMLEYLTIGLLATTILIFISLRA
ncbi:MAG: hypothetical protein V1810_05040 [Candidatus Beckwithbacteria bacterium]